MHNTTTINPEPFLSFRLLQQQQHYFEPDASFFSVFYCHGSNHTSSGTSTAVMFLFHALDSFSSFLFLLNLCFFLLNKLFTYLCYPTTPQALETSNKIEDDENELLPEIDDCSKEEEDFTGDNIIDLGEDILFFNKKSYQDEEEDSVLRQQGRDSNNNDTVSCFQVEDYIFVSPESSSFEDLLKKKEKLVVEDYNNINVPLTPSPIVSSWENDDLNEENTYTSIGNDFQNENKLKIEVLPEKSFFVIDKNRFTEGKNFHPRSSVHGDEGNINNFSGSLTTDSTSKSSVEWRSSAIFRDSETEYPLSSSSRRSSSRWETYTLFRKYDEEMLFFDRISAQKLNETETLRKIQYQPRSLSERITHKFMNKNRKLGRGTTNPYQELENAYVAQICLTWEALMWNYNIFQEASCMKSSSEESSTTWPARIAQQFQEFEVLLQRFIENEPYERGRRPEIYARTRIASPKLLQVPEFRECDTDEGNKEAMNSRITSWEFLVVLEDAIQTFMNFLKADKETPCQVLRALLKKKKQSTVVDPNHFAIVKKINKKKKQKLKELGKRRKCLKKRLKDETEMEILMSLIDMKVVSRVLRMPEINQEQLQWCEEKMNRVKIWDGKLQRDSSPIFFPVQ